MTNIIKIFLNDLKTVTRNVIAFIVIIGISILPALYAWFNIAANWDPYSATSGIAFAVCSKDTGYTYKTISINAGDEIINKLQSNDKMGWHFVTEQEALDGVEDGTYYAAVIIPENFSENLCSITTGDFNKAQLEYYVNEKKNAIAPKITDKGISAIESEVKTTYVSTITEVIATTLNLTADELSGNKTQAVSKITESLNDVVTNIDALSSGIDVFNSTLDTLSNLIKTNKNLLPNISDTLSQSGNISSDVKKSIDATRSASKKISDILSNMIKSVSSMQGSVSDSIDNALSLIDTNASAAASSLMDSTELCTKIISVNDTVIGVLDIFNEHFGTNTVPLITKLNNINTRQQALSQKLFEAANTLNSVGTLPKELQSELKQMVSSNRLEMSQLSTSFSSIKYNINQTVDSVYGVLDSASGLLQMINNDLPTIDDTLDSTQDTLDTMKSTFNNVKLLLSNSKTKTNELIEKVETLDSSTTIQDFLLKIIQNPEALGQFVAEPVMTVTHSIHPVENYGSGMAPFYTSLSFWVGGTILIAIVRTEPTKKQLLMLNKATPSQQYFGRYLIFFFIGQIQAFITSLGDIFLLQIQCNNIFLFILGSLFSSFVYTLFIYSLTITFNVVGKALVIIILVIQIAGAGGTFPVEVLPQTFQTISPYLPFRYSINALREAVAGPDIAAFWHYILLLLAFIPLALFIGLVLRKPCIKIISFLEKRLHQSELII